jgi:hypothetical protein
LGKAQRAREKPLRAPRRGYIPPFPPALAGEGGFFSRQFWEKALRAEQLFFAYWGAGLNNLIN